VKRGYFDTTIELPDGSEHDVRVSYEGYYQRAKVDGLPEDCYPAEGGMEITSVEFIGEWPEGLGEVEFNKLCDRFKDRLTERAWEDFHAE